MSLPSFADLELSADVQKALGRLGYENPAPVQTAVLLAVKSNRSAVIAAPAHSGRATALALAAVKLAAEADGALRVVLLAETRGRVFQLTELVRTFAAGRKGAVAVPWVAGLSAARQSALLERGAAIVVATPGALREAVHAGQWKLDQVTAVLVDGADEQIDAGLEEDLEAVVAAAPAQRLVIALANALSRDLEALTARRFADADRLVPEPPSVLPPLTWFSVDASEKFHSLTVIADRHDLRQALVYTNHRVTAEALAERLTAAGYTAESIGEDQTATARERSAKKFRSGGITFLVGSLTGLAGLELEAVAGVVHYEWPLDDAELAARHERLAPQGQAFALASGRELVRARGISRRGSPVRLGRLPLLGELAEMRLHANVNRIREALSGRNPAACRTVVDMLMAEGYEPAVIAGAAIRLLGTPELPSLPPPPPPIATATAAVHPEAAPILVSDPVEVAPVAPSAASYEPADWSPGVGASEDSVPASSGGDSDGGGYDSGGDSNYAYSDNAAEDGVVYPPGANFGDDETPGEGGGGGDDRGGRRGRRGGRGRGAPGGGRGGEGGPTASGMKRLWLNVGRMDRIQPRDIVGCILGETGLPSVAVGRVQLFERHTLVDVSGSFESQILEALNRAAVRGRKLKAKIAAY